MTLYFCSLLCLVETTFYFRALVNYIFCLFKKTKYVNYFMYAIYPRSKVKLAKTQLFECSVVTRNRRKQVCGTHVTSETIHSIKYLWFVLIFVFETLMAATAVGAITTDATFTASATATTYNHHHQRPRYYVIYSTSFYPIRIYVFVSLSWSERF